ncbi:MAG: thiamine phosphate synthase [Verrucomicrobiota bacterium]|jgi:thiamine-phosphate pyrophosphorylase|nr:thiamine phosphate synthase [Verrucomicrobiota bacterium]
MELDLSLYLVTDRRLSRGRCTVDLVREAVVGGATCVQLREKTGSTRAFIEEAKALCALLKPLQIPLIVNDRVDVALAAGADGLHLGQADMPLAEARRLVPPEWIIGISAESVADAVRAEALGADYVGISPVFATSTKRDTAPALGLEGVRAIRSAVSLPLVGIGGIQASNVSSVIRAGADGAAVVSAIVSADSPADAARILRKEIERAKQERR